MKITSLSIGQLFTFAFEDDLKRIGLEREDEPFKFDGPAEGILSPFYMAFTRRGESINIWPNTIEVFPFDEK